MIKIHKKNKKTYIYLSSVIFVIGVFILGINIGNGNIAIVKKPTISSNLPQNLDYSSVNQLYKLIKENYDGSLKNQQVLDGLKTGLAQSTNDPYTEYFSANQAKILNSEISGTFSGIGAQMGKNSQGQLIVVSPITGFPAYNSGVKAGDIITSINGKSTANLNVDEAVNIIRGPQGSFVKLDVIRGSSQLSFKIKRDTISLPSVNSKILTGNIGYMQITQFTDDTGSLALKAADQFRRSNVKGIILDLRGNPGGLVDQAVEVCNLWLKTGQLILTEKSGETVLQTYNATQSSKTLNGIPTVVLIDSGSASASEITAGALHDNNVASTLGVKSFGKGVVQQIFNLTGGAEAKITIAKWYRPNGANINKIGITPDKNVPLSDADISNKVDAQLNAALGVLTQN